MKFELLRNHTSPETAYLVDDYPYGFRLRCKIRYWLDYKKGHGTRLVSQTTNPKVPGEVWNKPKASTYLSGFAFMYLNAEGHVRWDSVSSYRGGAGQFDSAREFFNFSEDDLENVAITETVYSKVNPSCVAAYAASKV